MSQEKNARSINKAIFQNIKLDEEIEDYPVYMKLSIASWLIHHAEKGNIKNLKASQKKDTKHESILKELKKAKKVLGELRNEGLSAFKKVKDLDFESMYSFMKEVELYKSNNTDLPLFGIENLGKQFPFGYLHLERLTFEATGSEKEPVPLYSIPLAPGEEVNLIQKNWSKTKSEFSRLVRHEIEENITESTTETQELSESTSTQKQFQMGMSSSFQGSGKIGIVSLSGTASSDFNASLNNSKADSINESLKSTKEASLRSKEEHKTTFSITRDIGFEFESARKLINRNKNQPVLYNYYRYLREWTVKVHRYGVRLTGDFMIPYPGENLLENFRKRQELKKIIYEPYECSLTIQNFDEENPPAGFPDKPEPVKRRIASETYDGGLGGMLSDEFKFEFSVPAGYEVDKLELEHVNDQGQNVYFTASNNDTDTSLRGRSGDGLETEVHIGKAFDEPDVSINIYLHAKPTQQTLYEWKTEGIASYCEAESQEKEEARQIALEELKKLEEIENKVSQFELRNEERDEIVAKVTKLFTAGVFDDLATAPPDLARFIHEAFEWENMTYFLYPYFWNKKLNEPIDELSSMPTALAIDHPDIKRKAFLRSGYARVLLPVRPEHEDRVLGFSYNGDTENINIGEEIRSISQQIQDAHSNTYGYKELDPPKCDVEEKTEIIACWKEYTPTDSITMEAEEIKTTASDKSNIDIQKANLEGIKIENNLKDKLTEVIKNIDPSKITELSVTEDSFTLNKD